MSRLSGVLLPIVTVASSGDVHAAGMNTFCRRLWQSLVERLDVGGAVGSPTDSRHTTSRSGSAYADASLQNPVACTDEEEKTRTSRRNMGATVSMLQRFSSVFAA